MDELDQIPWKKLTHAYGSAEDVPGLLRALRTATPELRGEESPLWQLFGNIWHQGTVYEATTYAVPFLIELAADSRTPDRIGILGLLAEIARGSSYLDVHGNLLKEQDFEAKKSREIEWVRQAREAVAKGFDDFVAISNEESDVRYAAAHLLVQLREHMAHAATLVRRMLNTESRSSYRAGLLLLLAGSGDRSEPTVAVLSDAVNCSDALQRQAAALSIARLKLAPLPPGTRKAIVETIMTDTVAQSLDGLPWDAGCLFNPDELCGFLDASGRAQIADRLIAVIGSGQATHNQVETLLVLLFPRARHTRTPQVKARELSSQQAAAIRALFSMQHGRRIYYGHFPDWGLPDTLREWNVLASGCDPAPLDESLPLIARQERPDKAIAAGRLKVGDRITYRYFGTGIVTQIDVGDDYTEMTVLFDEEGEKNLSVPTDGAPRSYC